MNNQSRTLLEEAVLATLSYHDLLNMPLTAVEVWRYLFRGRTTPCFRDCGILEIEEVLNKLVGDKEIMFYRGYYSFYGNESKIEERQVLHAMSQNKWKRLRIVSWFLQSIPFLEMVAASGSLARDMAKKGSDLDVFLITKPKRIWTVRFIVTVLLDIFRLRRRPTGPTDNLVCLNHYLSCDGLELPYRSIYTALEYVRLVPLFGDNMCRNFRLANKKWIERYLVHVLSDNVKHHKTIKTSKLIAIPKNFGEFVLGGKIGDILENWLGQQQKKKIEKSGKEASSGGRIVASAMHLEFHPHSKEAPLIKLFNEHIKKIGLLGFDEQKDSGLN